MDKKALSGVVATSLIIVVAVISTIGFQGWFSDYSSQTFVDVEQKSLTNTNIEISDLVGDKIYLNSNENFMFDQIKIYKDSNLICNVSQNENLSILAYWSFDEYNSTHVFDEIGSNSGYFKKGVIEKIKTGFNETRIFAYPHTANYNYFPNIPDFFNYWTFEVLTGTAQGEKRTIIDYNNSGNKSIDLNQSIFNLAVGDEFTIYHNSSTLPQISSGKFGQGISFDYIDDTVYVGEVLDSEVNYGDQKSISFWFKAFNQTNLDAMLFFRESGCIGYIIQLRTDGRLSAQYKQGGSCSDYKSYSLLSSERYDDNQWHHLTLTFDRINEIIKLYVDKVLVSDILITNSSDANSLSHIRFGNNWDYSRPFNGSMDEVIIFNQTLTQEQINSVYDSSIAQAKGISYVDISSCNLNSGQNYEIVLVSENGIVSKEVLY